MMDDGLICYMLCYVIRFARVVSDNLGLGWCEQTRKYYRTAAGFRCSSHSPRTLVAAALRRKGWHAVALIKIGRPL